MAGSSPAMTILDIFTHPEQRRKLLLAVTGEIDDAVAGRAARPFQFVEPAQDRSAQRAREVAAPRAPVEAGLAQRPPRMLDLGEVDLQLFRDEFLALRREGNLVLVAAHELLPRHRVQHLQAEIAGEMVIADT